MIHNRVKHVREEFSSLLGRKNFMNVARESTMTNLVGTQTLEIVGQSFLADEDVIFGETNHDYIEREEQWYRSMSRNVNDIPGGAPAIWKAVASTDGTVNSNYGWCVWSSENGEQLKHVVDELKKNPASRRAVAIYTRPTMWKEFDVDGRSDFMCTNTVQYLVREGNVHSCVQMRSNDALFGFKNDFAWQKLVLSEVSKELDVPAGDVLWNVGSLHVYSRHFYLIDHFSKTGELSISKSRYKELYPSSEYHFDGKGKGK